MHCAAEDGEVAEIDALYGRTAESGGVAEDRRAVKSRRVAGAGNLSN